MTDGVGRLLMWSSEAGADGVAGAELKKLKITPAKTEIPTENQVRCGTAKDLPR